MEQDRLFEGEIKRTVDESTVSWDSKPSDLKRRPNIVMIVLDDVGYSQFGCHGSDIDTPALDSLAADGLRLRQFSRDALALTNPYVSADGPQSPQRRHGSRPEMVNGFPNTRGFVSRRRRTSPRCCVPAAIRR